MKTSLKLMNSTGVGRILAEKYGFLYTETFADGVVTFE